MVDYLAGSAVNKILCNFQVRTQIFHLRRGAHLLLTCIPRSSYTICMPIWTYHESNLWPSTMVKMQMFAPKFVHEMLDAWGIDDLVVVQDSVGYSRAKTQSDCSQTTKQLTCPIVLGWKSHLSRFVALFRIFSTSTFAIWWPAKITSGNKFENSAQWWRHSQRPSSRQWQKPFEIFVLLIGQTFFPSWSKLKEIEPLGSNFFWLQDNVKLWRKIINFKFFSTCVSAKKMKCENFILFGNLNPFF